MKVFDVSPILDAFHTFMRSLFPPDVQDPPDDPLPAPSPNGKPAKERDRPTVYIASPYTQGDQADNVSRQIGYWHELWHAGYAPYAPLLDHFLAIYLPCSYTDWCESDLIWLRKCDAVLRLSGESKGADAEVAEAKRLRIPVADSIEKLMVICPPKVQAAVHQDDYDWS